MTRKIRRIAFLTTAVVCFVVLLSCFCVVTQSGHQCPQEECPICRHIRVCEDVLRTMPLLMACVAVLSALGASYIPVIAESFMLAASRTPVSLKVKLSD